MSNQSVGFNVSSAAKAVKKAKEWISALNVGSKFRGAVPEAYARFGEGTMESRMFIAAALDELKRIDIWVDDDSIITKLERAEA
ncbi:hypothetical protein [Vibrio harveyi]|uniref:hypothetical protein n=1 Tax=Vibrio harveyi TaxID=669 RepID=UPI0025B1FE24|nr:hypothetical protein [Vibrio harveyi]WJT09269.1 hypothetical protein PH545_24900 [Vibrio harveyi]